MSQLPPSTPELAANGESEDAPPSHFNFVDIIRQQAKISGVSTEVMIWKAAEALFDKAASGDIDAAKLMFDRTCGVMDKGGASVVIDARSVHLGPPPPAAVDLGAYAAAFTKVAAQIGIAAPAEFSDDDLAELLS